MRSRSSSSSVVDQEMFDEPIPRLRRFKELTTSEIREEQNVMDTEDNEMRILNIESTTSWRQNNLPSSTVPSDRSS